MLKAAIMEQRLFDEEINLFSVVSFLRRGMAIIIVCCTIGVALAGMFLWRSQPYYQASAQLVLATTSAPTQLDPDAVALVEPREHVTFRLRSPSAFDQQTVSTCSDGGPVTAEQISQNVRVTAPSVPNDVIEISFTAPTAELARQCVAAIVRGVQEQQTLVASISSEHLKSQIRSLQDQLVQNSKLLKEAQDSGWQQAIYLATRDDAIALRKDIADLTGKLELSKSATLLSPIYAPSNPASPTKITILTAGLFVGFVIGVLVNLLKSAYLRQRNRRSRSNG
ncbi:Wzz/FepE/Etk N-terminal domain-containing protein [Rhizobium sp. NZLR8]|uniref:Wzz/FepE/Etk N-terminal domain-containing protein n=1 Tax=Rhizobium sp. NZLR8 TaxID=2731104 RepID=UPI002180B315|nr:Wzz/FepE/Etk N-terminal domain-containing protein [Rhizobium sp. NZLR8]